MYVAIYIYIYIYISIYNKESGKKTSEMGRGNISVSAYVPCDHEEEEVWFQQDGATAHMHCSAVHGNVKRVVP